LTPELRVVPSYWEYPRSTIGPAADLGKTAFAVIPATRQDSKVANTKQQWENIFSEFQNLNGTRNI
jgi:hypothetical protein